MNIKPTVEHVAFRDDLLALLRKHSGHIDSAEMLALCAYTTGQILAMIDAQKWSPSAGMDLIAKNIELGNAHAIADAATWMGSA